MEGSRRQDLCKPLTLAVARGFGPIYQVVGGKVGSKELGLTGQCLKAKQRYFGLSQDAASQWKLRILVPACPNSGDFAVL